MREYNGFEGEIRYILQSVVVFDLIPTTTLFLSNTRFTYDVVSGIPLRSIPETTKSRAMQVNFSGKISGYPINGHEGKFRDSLPTAIHDTTPTHLYEPDAVIVKS